ncbi:response regulator [Phycisphaerales bacterium AB-hyl4]|uniref:Response regulator n=1 Tax=Natronomicrosphaera hydrolytica TaxID=3242702 RepID=A0ABV4UB59_9BACT
MSELSSDAPAILIVEDEPDLLELLRYNLVREGYRVQVADTGEEGLRLARAAAPDLMLLDLMLPAMDGLEVCKAIKSRDRTSRTAIIMLTAKGEEADIVRGLEAGADDYITKPFSPRVLLARINSVLRRRQEEQGSGSPRTIEAASLTIDPERHEVLAQGKPVPLTATEFRLLVVLATRPGRVFTRQQLIEAVHEGYAAVTDRSVDVQVVALRKKLGSVGNNIETVRGVGYRYKEAHATVES